MLCELAAHYLSDATSRRFDEGRDSSIDERGKLSYLNVQHWLCKLAVELRQLSRQLCNLGHVVEDVSNLRHLSVVDSRAPRDLANVVVSLVREVLCYVLYAHRLVDA